MNRTLRTIAALLAFLTIAASSRGDGIEWGDVRLYECTMTSQPPKIDGQLDDACWKQAEETDAFTRTLSTEDAPPSVQTHFRVVYDEANLYIAIRCDELHPERIRANVTDDDTASVCGDDCVEIFCHPNPDGRDYYQFVVNARGVRYDGRVLDASWNGQWQAATHIGKDAWVVECAIALKSFPDCRGLWRFNVNREFRSTDKLELYCWSNTFGGFHTPERFGCLIFAGPFANLRRGFLIQAANYARSTIEKRAAFEHQKREIQQMRATLPAPVFAPFEKTLAELDRDDRALTQKYSNLKDPSLEDWRAFDGALDELNRRSAKVYWDLKFHALLND